MSARSAIAIVVMHLVLGVVASGSDAQGVRSFDQGLIYSIEHASSQERLPLKKRNRFLANQRYNRSHTHEMRGSLVHASIHPRSTACMVTRTASIALWTRPSGVIACMTLRISAG